MIPKLPNTLRFLISLLCLGAALTGKAQILGSDSVFTDLPAEEYKVNAGGLPYYTYQIRTSQQYEVSTSPTVSIEYPVYEELSAAEVAIIKEQGFEVADSIAPTALYGISRKQGLLDVSFCPIICKAGKYLRLTSCKIVVNGAKMRTKSIEVLSSETSARWATESVLAEGSWVKIRVSKEGIYELSATTLAGLGFADISKVKLYGYGGRIQEEAWDFDAETRVPDDLCEIPLYRKDNAVMFFAEGTVRWTYSSAYGRWIHENQPYSQYSYYFLTEGEVPLTFDTLESATDEGGQEISSIFHHAVLDDDADAMYEGGRELYDSYDFANGNSRAYTLEATDIVEGESGTVDIGFAASNSTSSTAVTVTLNGASLGSFSVSSYGSDLSGYESRRTYTTTDLAESNTFAFYISPTTTARLNYIRLSYERLLNAVSAPFSFTPNTDGAATLVIENASSSTRLWRIGNADNVACNISGTLDGTTFSAAVDDASQRYVIVDVDATYDTPEIVGTVANQNLHADSAADMVIIVPTSGLLTEQAERLAAAHMQAQGLRVNVVTAEQLYNEFSSGTPDASAYRRYMKMLYDRAETDDDMPRYLLLFGDCAWDNRMITDYWIGYDPDDFLLAFEVNNGANTVSTTSFSFGTLTSYVTDDFYGWLDDSEGTTYRRNKLDLAIGRFPCHDAAIAKIFVDKSIAYMNNEVSGAWKNKVYILGDDINSNLHMEAADEVAAALEEACDSNLLIHKVYWDAYTRTYTATGYTYPQATAALQQYMAQGALLFNNIGHGSPDQISHSKILTKDDFLESSSSRLPLWIFASCEISPYDTRTDDIGRYAISNETGGAIAVICASRSVYASSNEALNTYFFKYLLDGSGGTYSMGDALRETKVALVDNSADLTINKLKYVLLGDPALFLGSPKQRVVLDSINGTSLENGGLIQLKAGSVASFSGYVCNMDGTQATDFTGYMTAIVSDRIDTITCQNNSGASEAMVYTDRTKTIFEGSDSVINGRFTIQVSIPRDISYTTDCGRITLYAVNDDHSIEANGYSEQFYLNGTDEDAASDTIAPTIYPYLDSPDFVNGGITSTSPIFMADISDDTGINVSGVSIGHDMELTIDGSSTQSYVLNDYFTYTFGDYRSGQVVYELEDLAIGAHTLTFKAWDVNNNSTTVALDFYVSETVAERFDVNATTNPASTSTNFVTVLDNSDAETLSLVLEVYDILGHKIWSSNSTTTSSYDVQTWGLTSSSGAPVPSGLYLYRAIASGENGSQTTDAKKIIVIRQ